MRALLIFCFSVSSFLFAAEKGTVLVVLSSEGKITLKDNKVHPTGFFLPELMGPVKALKDAGYKIVVANPKGTKPVMDKVSDSAMWFGDVQGATPEQSEKAKKEYKEIRVLCQQMGICGEPGKLVGTLTPEKLSEVKKKGFTTYAGIFFPGGHAPMEDLWKDPNVKDALRYFHQDKKPTALICHAPVALLAAMDDSQGFISARLKDDRAAMAKKSKDWIYRDYRVSVFTTREEQQEEPGGSDNALGGFVKFYPDDVLEKAGAYVTRVDRWKSGVAQDRELITGQNPFSHNELADVLLKALDGQTKQTGI